MPVRLCEVKISHFKTFRGEKIIGPIEPDHLWLSIIGCNGSGKSNVMDAIAFVLGEKNQPLRCEKIEDLVYKDDQNNPVPESDTYVSITLESNNFRRITFKRTIEYKKCRYSINDELVQKSAYVNGIKSLGLNIESKNFLIYQGLIDRIIDATPGERTIIFEETSRSIELKAEYDRLNSELEKNGITAKSLKEDLRLLKKEKHQLNQYMEADIRMETVKTNYEKLKTEFFLFKIRTDELILDDLTKLIITERNAKDEIENLRQNEKINYQKLKQDNHVLMNQVDMMEAEKKQLEEELRTLKNKLMEISKVILNSEKMSVRNNHMIFGIKRRKEKHEATIAELEEHLIQLSESREKFLNENTSVQTPDEESEYEYRCLKAEVMTKSTKFTIEFRRENCRKNSLNKQIQDENRILNEIIRDIRIIETKINCLIEDKDNMMEFIRKLEENQKQYMIMRKEREDASLSLKNVENLKMDLENIQSKMQQIEINIEWTQRAKRDKMIVETLKSEVHGVHCRIYNLCQPNDDRYAVAMTKVFGKNFSAIVVDNKQVGVECVRCLKLNKLEPQNFLPIHSVKFSPLRERLREIPNAKLLYDVINFPPFLQNVILHIVGSTLVCENANDASMIAYEFSKNEGGSQTNLDTVSQNGTRFKKNGSFSGGQVSITAKATLMDVKKREDLLAIRSDLLRQLKNIEKLPEMELRLKEIEKSISMNKKYLENSKNKLSEIDEEIKEKKKSLELLQAKKEKSEETIERLIKDFEDFDIMMSTQERNIREELNEIEDDTFRDFCANRNLSNIREYEKYLELKEEHQIKLREIDVLEKSIQNQISFERQRESHEENLKKLENKQSELQLTIDKLILEKNQLVFDVENKEKILRDLITKLNIMNTKVVENEKKLQQLEKRLSGFSTAISKSNKKINHCTIQVTKKLEDRHILLKEAKMKMIHLPLTNDSMEVLSGGDDSEKTRDEIYQEESQLDFDFSLLSEDKFNLTDPVEIEQCEKMYQKQLLDLEVELKKTKISNAAAKLKNVDAELKTLNAKIKTNENERKNISNGFDIVKHERIQRFSDFFNEVVEKVDIIYKEIVGDNAAQAMLMTFNREEPYLNGIKFECVVPRKKYFPMHSLSGGERTMAALALILALQAVYPSPFLIMDEIDAPLDKKHIHCLTKYMERLKIKQQIILITLKSDVFKHADLLIGVYKQVKETETDSPPRSKIWLLEMNRYKDDSNHEDREP